MEMEDAGKSGSEKSLPWAAATTILNAPVDRGDRGLLARACATTPTGVIGLVCPSARRNEAE